MQVYRGMDIITNKVPESERHGVEHALMSFKNPGEQYVVGQWVQDALAVVCSCGFSDSRVLLTVSAGRLTKRIRGRRYRSLWGELRTGFNTSSSQVGSPNQHLSQRVNLPPRRPRLHLQRSSLYPPTYKTRSPSSHKISKTYGLTSRTYPSPPQRSQNPLWTSTNYCQAWTPTWRVDGIGAIPGRCFAAWGSSRRWGGGRARL